MPDTSTTITSTPAGHGVTCSSCGPVASPSTFPTHELARVCSELHLRHHAAGELVARVIPWRDSYGWTLAPSGELRPPA